MSEKSKSKEPEVGGNINEILGQKAYFVCGPETTNLEKGELQNAVSNTGVGLPPPENTSVAFACAAVPEQKIKDLFKPSASPAISQAPAAPAAAI